MGDLAESQLWSMLNDESRVILDKGHTIATYSKGIEFTRHPKEPLLVLEGVICLTTFDHTNVILVPGDMVFSPDFRPKTPYVAAMAEKDLTSLYNNQHWHFISDVKLAIFDPEAIRSLLDSNQSFTKAVLDCQLNLLAQMSFLQANLYHYSAYDAVRYIIRLCRIYGVNDLTHSQIALMCSRNRSTVTKTIHEICLAEPELFSIDSECVEERKSE